MCDVAFEGPAHPHKANILKYLGQKVVDVAEEPDRIDLELASKVNTLSASPAR